MEPSDGFVGAVLGVLGTAILAFFAWLTQRHKGKIEDTVSVRSQWEKLNSGMAQRLAAVEKAFAEYRIETAAEIAKMKTDHATEIADMKLNHAAEMKAMRQLNESLQRMIAQHSQSAAYRLDVDEKRGGK